MAMKRNRDPLDAPFLCAKDIVYIFNGTISLKLAYEIMHKLKSEKDKDGNYLIDPGKMPPVGKMLVPTDIFCKRYGIKRKKSTSS